MIEIFNFFLHRKSDPPGPFKFKKSGVIPLDLPNTGYHHQALKLKSVNN